MYPGELAGLKPPQKQLRDYFGEALLEACRVDERIIVLDGDLGNSTMTHMVKKAFPDRFYNIGIAESNLVGIGAGFAACGYIPFITSFPNFLLCNAFDQLRLSISIAGLNAKIAGSHAGVSTNREGPPAMSIEDFTLVGALPPFVILAPCDGESMRFAVKAAAAHVGPVYIRSSRTAVLEIYSPGDNFEIGRANLLRDGSDVTLIACGLMVPIALDAAAVLSREGIQARILDMHTVKPVDRSAVEAAARDTGAIVVAEEHLTRGGLGANIAQVVVETFPVPLRFIGFRDTYAESGSVEELLFKYGMTAAHIAEAARQAISAKRRQIL